ncbi:cytochrome b/b6 domain-containing protein [Aliarcobacter butzleri]|uniref:cytochrome b/b6 domain-containing protein n=1 Tax=Aliarcobacter butzleri TaxID=28197 RepID=UPI0021B1A35C|nr:cytochrome b/b6 domain-containing protein [Aliarcobacter butzleri]MCT7563153.1 cytochrome b/b6 domain-containing protein [Aliarcobacter butzleri]MCT7578628.1 cytochrome b/b6 domain-containing protein [Aliarcobacter butzleri]MCT7647569.1 cytochrome b/b6 domain-containing protein [Aliarcobacter butzleri]
MIRREEKILHWLILLSFLGLCATALAAEYFFSKEEILNSFKISLPMVGANIAPVDQFFISRIARRNTWDIHLYFGIAFSIFLLIWITINLIRKNKKNAFIKTMLFGSSIVLCVSGIWMWLRLYIEVSEETFGLLKKIHYYAYWTFIITLIGHIVMIIKMENTNKKGVLSNMINFKNICIISSLSFVLFSQNLYANNASSDLAKWTNDEDYINGVLYIEGDKGAEVLLKEISNCPYEKCKKEDIDQTQFGTKKIEIKKPDFKKAIELLKISSDRGNALASEKLLTFLTQRVDYKSHKPNQYLVNLLYEDTGLTIESYKNLINKAWQDGVKTNKSCLSQYLAGEIFELGLVENKKDIKIAKKYYEKASQICPSNNIHSHLSKSKLSTLK